MKILESIALLIFSTTILTAQIQTIAVLELQAKGISKVEASVLTDRLRSELVNAGEYVVVDRKNMEQILKEHRFQLSGCTSNQCAIEVGKILGVQHMLTGSIGKLGEIYTVQLQILDVESSEIVQSATYDQEGDLELLLQEGIQTALSRVLGVEKAVEKISSIGTGILELSVQPDNVQILIDGLEYKVSDVQHLEMLKGQHTVEVQLPNHYGFSKEIIIQESRTFPLSVGLINGEQDLNRLQWENKLLVLGSGSTFGAAVISAIVAQSMYKKYDDTYSVSDAQSYRSKTETFDIMTFGLTGVAVGTTIYTYLNKKKEHRLKVELGVDNDR
jgi:TolB-like protein